jgi:hypothetical protein
VNNDPDLASFSPGTTRKGNIRETLLRRSTSNLPLPTLNASIEVLPDDVLLIIFGFYRASSPPDWHRLTHVCRRWRRIVFASPRALDLRLYCLPGTPVLKIGCWPAFPINLQYMECQVFDPHTSEDEDNILAALKHSDRIHFISLIVTESLLEKLGSIEQSFPELEDLALKCQSLIELPMPIPGYFRWGRRLRSLRLTGISLTELPYLLSSTPNLVELQLHEIVSTMRLSPQTFASALSGMTWLQSLSLHTNIRSLFHSTRVNIPPFSGERIVLPALTHLRFRGIKDEYVNSFVARIDTPHLADIEILFAYQTTVIDVSPLSQFIDRVEMQKSHRRADILTSGCAISMSLTNSRGPTRLELGISSRQQLDWKLFSMARICNQFSQTLLSVRDLRIETTQTSNGRDGMSGERWTQIIRFFTGARGFHVAGELAADILQALRPTVPTVRELTSGALPALTNLFVVGPRSGALQDAIRSITGPRKRSGNPIMGKYINLDRRNDKILRGSSVEDDSMRILPIRTCRYCNVRLEDPQNLIRHPNHRAPPEECEEWCRFCRRPWPQCHSPPRLRVRRRSPDVGPSDESPVSISPSGHDIPGDPPPGPFALGFVKSTTQLHTSESPLDWRPVGHQRSSWRFVPNLRSLGTLFNSRLRKQTESTGSSRSSDQPEPLDVWPMTENEVLE